MPADGVPMHQVERQSASEAPGGRRAHDATRAATAGLRLERHRCTHTGGPAGPGRAVPGRGHRLRQIVRPPTGRRSRPIRTMTAPTWAVRWAPAERRLLAEADRAADGRAGQRAGFVQMRSPAPSRPGGRAVPGGPGLRPPAHLGRRAATSPRPQRIPGHWRLHAGAARNGDDWRLFAQDRWTSDGGRLVAVGGLRVDHTFFGGTRAAEHWRCRRPSDENLTLWSSVSRAVRVPSRGENDCEDVAVAVIPPGRMGNPLPVQVLASSASGQVVESVRPCLTLRARRRWGAQLALDAVLSARLRSAEASIPAGLTGAELSMFPAATHRRLAAAGAQPGPGSAAWSCRSTGIRFALAAPAVQRHGGGEEFGCRRRQRGCAGICHAPAVLAHLDRSHAASRPGCLGASHRRTRQLNHRHPGGCTHRARPPAPAELVSHGDVTR